MFADGLGAIEVAAALEVSTKAAYTWRRAWVAGGADALASKGAPGPARKLSADQVARLAARLDEGPAAAGYDDQRWTLTRVAKLISTMFCQTLSVQGVSVLLRRLGWTPQVPAHRATERDEEQIAHWRRHQWPAVKGSRAGWARGSSSPTSVGTR